LINILLDILFPRRCPICDGIVKPGTLIHPECEIKLNPITKSYCMKCGKPLKDSTNEYCFDCKKSSHIYERGRVAYTYEGVAPAVYRLKYNGRQEYADYLGSKMGELLRSDIVSWNADAIIPVPISKKRLRKRGYNQAELLAKAMGKTLNIPVFSNLVSRVIDTAPMKLLNPLERQNNLKKAFKIDVDVVKLNTIIIVDDIYTTGTTIDTVARVLRENGVRSVYFVTLTIGNGL